MTPDIKRILVPIDFSANSMRALDYARGVAQRFDASLHLVHVCEVPSLASMDAYAIAYSDWRQRLGAEAESQLNAVARRASGLRVTTEVLFGNAANAIIDCAESNAVDVIVMGTHGRGAVMHMVMGNVAERVVRGAPCPVLTVREPRTRETSKASATKLTFASIAVVAAALMMPLAASAQTESPAQMTQVTPGAEVFRTYCATCHGTSARGDGPLASSMKRKPANLTELAQKNGGTFPSEIVFKTIDGRERLKGHGGPDMPVWGDAFERSREAGDPDRVKKVIQSLVDYLESIQLRPAHGQP